MQLPKLRTLRSSKLIPLTAEQINLIELTLKRHDSIIITQAIWQELQSVLNMNSLTFARRRSASNRNFHIGYSWEEYQLTSVSKKSIVQITCQYCTQKYIALAFKLAFRKHKISACALCYREHHQYDDEWRKQNSVKQKIAQNKETTLQKHRENSRKLWVGARGVLMREAHKKSVSRPAYKEKMTNIMRAKWESDPEYRNRVCGKGVYKHTGLYDLELSYHSKLELAFILQCIESKRRIKRCDIHVDYFDSETNTTRKYYPDFIVDDTTIVEVKGQRWIDISPIIFAAKCDAIVMYAQKHNLQFRVVLDIDLKQYIKQANIYHETQKQKVNSI